MISRNEIGANLIGELRKSLDLQENPKKATAVQIYPRGGQGNSDKVRKQR
jgi:hypothetical protein